MNVRRAVEWGKDARHKYALRRSPVLFAFLADASHSATAAVYSIVYCVLASEHRIGIADACLTVTVAESIHSPLCLFSCNNWIYYISFVYLALSSDCVNVIWLRRKKCVNKKHKSKCERGEYRKYSLFTRWMPNWYRLLMVSIHCGQTATQFHFTVAQHEWQTSKASQPFGVCHHYRLVNLFLAPKFFELKSNLFASKHELILRIKFSILHKNLPMKIHNAIRTTLKTSWRRQLITRRYRPFPVAKKLAIGRWKLLDSYEWQLTVTLHSISNGKLI